MDFGDESSPPPTVDCHLGHKQNAEWDGGAWVYPRKEDCPICMEQQHKAETLDRWIIRTEKAGVPSIHQLWSALGSEDTQRKNLYVDHFNEHVYEAVRQWKWPRWLALCGPVGTGKTSWATAMFMDILELRPRLGGIWTTEAGIFREAEAQALAHGHPGRLKYLDRLIKVPILMIDDIGASGRKPTDWQGSSMRDLIDQRHANKRVTFFTTNMNKWEDLQRLYGDHIVSRIRQAAGKMLRLDGPDRRLF